MKDPKYGTMKKKVVFYDSDKRYAELKIRLQHDGLTQALFFRSILTGYLSQDEDILNFIDKLKISKNHANRSKKSVRGDRELIKSGKDVLDKLDLDSNEIENIFDILERENPDL
jgi:hypothetical protein|tara:strand:- start:1012 stop:1353 length:342 start_codon:yes stop_codon:yes gene_type:complete